MNVDAASAPAAALTPVVPLHQVQRQRLRTWAEQHGYPALRLTSYSTVVSGQAGWAAFTSGADSTNIERGIAAIEALEETF